MRRGLCSKDYTSIKSKTRIPQNPSIKTTQKSPYFATTTAIIVYPSVVENDHLVIRGDDAHGDSDDLVIVGEGAEPESDVVEGRNVCDGNLSDLTGVALFDDSPMYSDFGLAVDTLVADIDFKGTVETKEVLVDAREDVYAAQGT
ncbi:hypothetical protein LR48_Vigan11g069800 [Vigna angularis]|uniref:Uncharacterized protein n=1 Tax=Phaseolus angularis TaxID=3914 RepID=A0A0L9VRG4_PHAAN|nr:hypothetical protein LR48_Vigan11g069800 [Vigna angularis]